MSLIDGQRCDDEVKDLKLLMTGVQNVSDLLQVLFVIILGLLLLLYHFFVEVSLFHSTRFLTYCLQSTTS